MRTLHRFVAVALVVSLVSASATLVRAGTITFPNQTLDLSGTGFGNVLTVLAVHANKSEFGSVLWNGASDVITDDGTNQSQTRAISELTKIGITDSSKLGLVFNIAESGNEPDINVFDFSMRFTDSTGAPLFGDVNYTAPGGGLLITQVANGVGGAGWLFRVNLSPAEEALAFGSSTNRIGMIITSGNAFTLSSGGPDSFFITNVPEPASLGLLVLGGALWLWRPRIAHRR